MSLNRNLMLAESAAKYAHDALRGRASNRPEDIVHTLHEELRTFARDSFTDADVQKDYVLSALNGTTIGTRGNTIYQHRWTAIEEARTARTNAGRRLESAAILQDGIGNCFEHAVLACHHLNGKGVTSYMVDTDDDTNHCFVVLGLAGNLDGTTANAAPNAAPGQPFNAAFAVVCDPWYHEWFAIGTHWSTKMHRILRTTNKRSSGQLPAQVSFTFTGANHVT
jgi:hypothetical protein